MDINKTNFTKDLLAKLMRGIAKTYIVDVEDGSVNWSASTFANAGLLYSVEGSFNLDWPEPSIDEIRVDQGLQTIAMDVDKGDIVVSANYPSVAAVPLQAFFKNTGSMIEITSPDGVVYKGPGLFIEPKTTEVSMYIEDQDAQFGIAIARIALTARLAYDADNKLWYIGLNGRVLANLAENEPDLIVAEKKVVNG